MALRKDVADPNHLVTFSDFSKWAAGGGNVKLAVSAEFASSSTALPKFEQVYDFTLKPEQLVTLYRTAISMRSGPNRGEAVDSAMRTGGGGINVGVLGKVVPENGDEEQICRTGLIPKVIDHPALTCAPPLPG